MEALSSKSSTGPPVQGGPFSFFGDPLMNTELAQYQALIAINN